MNSQSNEYITENKVCEKDTTSKLPKAFERGPMKVKQTTTNKYLTYNSHNYYKQITQTTERSQHIYLISPRFFLKYSCSNNHAQLGKSAIVPSKCWTGNQSTCANPLANWTTCNPLVQFWQLWPVQATVLQKKKKNNKEKNSKAKRFT